MTRVTRNVAPEAADDLLERPPRASLAFTAGTTLIAMPVAFRRCDGRYWIGLLPDGSDPAPQPGAIVTLLIDTGWYWFELRAIKLRGRLESAPQPPAGGPVELNWLELIPDKIVAWDYDTLREES